MKSLQVVIPIAVDRRASRKQVLYVADNPKHLLDQEAVLLDLLKAQIKVHICLKSKFYL